MQPPIPQPAERIAARFAGRWQQGYVRGKLRHDPAFATIAALLTEAGAARPVLDLGCGMGLLGQWLRECGHRGAYLGIDNDPRKLRAGRAAAATLRPALELRFGDLQALPEFSGHVVLLDALHYLARAPQQALLAACAQRLGAGDRLLIRSVLRDASWRYRITQAEELLAAASGWMRTGAHHIPTGAELSERCAALGLRVSRQPLWGRTPFNSWLIVAWRAPA
ncbi:MAG: class I SAM-dependent methyltransferase [Metallibacterium scheffleri]|jgi:SAM-dependent methyltransferase|uniref:class I SAM-dependent methyltransferase n=1 Tax=Metallibacterium scheffleri TaxID=993689 RepID=UPI0026EFFD08|nr:class I SAM-dependent methyltransferase [Metallibacterium scheffleri]MCK9367424.1 class I SAM-dependent methyltransferase [Metallibacterium scheffleri]